MAREDQDDSKYYGEPLRYDKNFKGPLSGRSCTDIFCLLIFVLFLGFWGFIGYYAFTNGDLDRLLVPTDSQGLKCGVDYSVANKPYLLFFDLKKCIDFSVPITGCKTPQVCVEECPTENFVWSRSQCTANLLSAMKAKLICVPAVQMESLTTCDAVDSAISSDLCAQWYLQSESLLNRCISGLPPSECPRIPKQYLQQGRPKRDLVAMMNRNILNSSSILAEPLVGGDEQSWWSGLSSSLLGPNSKAPAIEPIAQCEERRKLSEAILVQKVQSIDTKLARFMGNLISHVTNDTEAQQMAQMIVEDVIDSWWHILLGLGVAMLICLLAIIIMRWVAKPLIWLSILGVIAMLSYTIYYSAVRYSELKANPVHSTVDLNFNSIVKSYLAMKDTWMWILIITSVLLLIILLVVICLRKRIVIAIALVKEGSKAVSSTTSTVFFPVFPWLLQISIIAFAVIVGLYLASVGSPVYKLYGLNSATCVCSGAASAYSNGQVCDPLVFAENCRNPTLRTTLLRQTGAPCSEANCLSTGIQGPAEITYFHIANVVGFFWVVFFISAFGEMVLAATFATWYWTFHKSDVPFFTLTRAFGRTIRYHLGTLAFGSLIITICRLIRVMLEWADQKLKAYDNPVTRAILCCMRCFFWCLEKFLRFLNKNAYIMCAIHGKNFCTSAKDSFNLLMRNFLRVIAVDKVTEFLFFLSKILLTFGMGALTYTFFTSEYNDTQLHYNLVPVLVVAVGTYLIATVFFGVYSMAVDTLFLCFLEDCERNDGSAEKPFYMSKQLMQILGKKNVIPRNQYQ